MKTILKILILSVVFAFSVISCRKDDPIPDPPSPPKPEMTLSVSDIALMEGMKATVTLSNASAVSIVPDQANIVEATYQQGKISLEAKKSGSVIVQIIDKLDSKRSVSLKVLVIPLKSGIMNGEGEMVFEAKYCFQTTKTLHLAPFGALRKEHYLRVPMQKKLQVGATVSFEYKTPGAEKQTLQAKIFVIKDKTIYATMPDGGYLIFEKK